MWYSLAALGLLAVLAAYCWWAFRREESFRNTGGDSAPSP